MKKRYQLRDNRGITFVPLDDIISFSGNKSNYTVFSIIGMSPVRQSYSVGYHYERLVNEGFYRINKSDVVNLIHVKRVEDFTVIMDNGAEFDIHKEEREILLTLIPSC